MPANNPIGTTTKRNMTLKAWPSWCSDAASAETGAAKARPVRVATSKATMIPELRTPPNAAATVR